MTKQQHGYHHLETDDEVLKRLKDEHVLSSMRSRCIDETFDQWLDAHKQTRKLVYIS